MKKLWHYSLLPVGLLASVANSLTISAASGSQNTANVAEVKSVKPEASLRISELTPVRPHSVVIERDAPDLYRVLKADYDAGSTSKGERERMKIVNETYKDKSLPEWERASKASMMSQPYQPIEVDVLDGVRDPLGIGFEEYTLRGVVSKREVYGPPEQPKMPLTESEQVFWYWEVPRSLRNDLAWNTVNGGIGKTREVMAVWFCPKKWSLQSRDNPTLCYFAEKGLVWRKQTPLKETLAVLPEPEAFNYQVYPTVETVLVSDSGKYVWVIASTLGYDKSSKRVLWSTFIFVYNDKGKLTKTVHIPDYARRHTGRYAVMGGEAFILTFVKSEPVTSKPGEAEYQTVVMDASGTPVCRLVDQNGEGVQFLYVSRDGRRAVSYKTDDKDDKQYACFYKLDELKGFSNK